MITSVFSTTPVVGVHDARGLTVRELQYHRHPDTPSLTDSRITRHGYDIRGLLSHSTDPRLHNRIQTDNSVKPNFTYIHAINNHVLCIRSADAGTTLTLNDAAGRTALAVTADNTLRTWQYEDPSLPGRPLSVTELVFAESVRITERFVYADASVEEQALNLAGQCVRHYDTAGRIQLNSLALSGSVISQSHQLLADELEADWQGADERTWGTYLSDIVYMTQSIPDATGTVLTTTDAASNRQRMTFDVAGQLKATWLKLKGGDEQVIVKSVSYSASGQKLREVHGNGILTTYCYEPQTQRMTGVKTERLDGNAGRAKVLQDLRYIYDPVGNVLKVSNGAEATRFWRNQKVVPKSTYVYDSLYQLVSATGREVANAGQARAGQLPAGVIMPVDGSTFTNYIRTYTYDTAGNLTQVRHASSGVGNSHTTTITVSDRSNRAVLSNLTTNPAQVDKLFTAGGQQRQLQTGQTLSWNLRGELQRVTPVVRTGLSSDRETYHYDSKSQRVSKTTLQHAGNIIQAQRVVYLPRLELRSTVSGGVWKESRQVITVAESGGAQVRMLHWETGKPDGIRNNQVRYSYGDLIQSTGLEVDEDGYVISREEYYPYGGTAIFTVRNQVEADYKTVRYSGKERDATGLYYYGYRYYQPWAGRWLSADPAGTVDGLNLYRMVSNNPVALQDIDGRMESSKEKMIKKKERRHRKLDLTEVQLALDENIQKNSHHPIETNHDRNVEDTFNLDDVSRTLPGELLTLSKKSSLSQKRRHRHGRFTEEEKTVALDKALKTYSEDNLESKKTQAPHEGDETNHQPFPAESFLVQEIKNDSIKFFIDEDGDELPIETAETLANNMLKNAVKRQFKKDLSWKNERHRITPEISRTALYGHEKNAHDFIIFAQDVVKKINDGALDPDGLVYLLRKFRH